jgi:hypothetical protein
MRDLLILCMGLAAALAPFGFVMVRRLRDLEHQVRVHSAMLAGAEPTAVKTEAEHVQEWLDLYNAEPDGTPKKQALKARLAARGMTFD